MKHKDNKEKNSAVEAEDMHEDKTMGIEVEIPENEKNSEESSELEELKKKLKETSKLLDENTRLLNEKADLLEEKTKQCDENYSRFLRMQADFDNFKKRTARERDELFFTSLESIVKDILPIIDNMERAIDSFKSSGLENTYIDGLEMIRNQLFMVLEKNGLKEIEALGLDFDPNMHHAVMQVQGERDEQNKVKQVFQKGYFLGSKVIRPAMVQVVVNN
jgi:molecular chaperone GrpE